MIKVITDYPFVKLGDIPGRIAPTRTVEAHWYDGDKYVGIVLPDGQKTSIKAGYCYANSIRPFRLHPLVFSLPLPKNGYSW